MENIHYSFFNVKYVEVLPEEYPCPDCGQQSKRNSIGERTLQEANLDQPTFLIVRMSVCRCDNVLRGIVTRSPTGPQRTIVSRVIRTTGTGASGEIRSTLPRM